MVHRLLDKCCVSGPEKIRNQSLPTTAWSSDMLGDAETRTGVENDRLSIAVPEFKIFR